LLLRQQPGGLPLARIPRSRSRAMRFIVVATGYAELSSKLDPEVFKLQDMLSWDR
jgi:hypothetical protein